MSKKNAGIKLLAEIQSHFPEVTKVVDATRSRPITLAVDSSDCEKGTPEHTRACVWAICAARHTGKFALVRRWVTVLIDPITFFAERFINDPVLAAAIHAFDKTGKNGVASFTPGIYTMRRPTKRQRLDRTPAGPVKNPGSHPHRAPQAPLRQTWAAPSPKLQPVLSKAHLAK